MRRITALAAAGCLVGCGNTGGDRHAGAPARLPAEVEARYQEREVLRYALDQLEQAADAYRPPGVPAVGQPAAGGERRERRRP